MSNEYNGKRIDNSFWLDLHEHEEATSWRKIQKAMKENLTNAFKIPIEMQGRVIMFGTGAEMDSATGKDFENMFYNANKDNIKTTWEN
jgi:hypothetical protein